LGVARNADLRDVVAALGGDRRRDPGRATLNHLHVSSPATGSPASQGSQRALLTASKAGSILPASTYYRCSVVHQPGSNLPRHDPRDRPRRDPRR
jgi:hypothetical protein